MNNVARLCLITAVAAFLPSCSLFEPASAPSAPRRAPRPQPSPSSQPQSPPPQVPSIPAPAVPLPPSAPEAVPAPIPPREHQLSAASRALVAQAQTQVAAKDFMMAAGTIERALRIESDNPLLWLELGKVRYAAANYPQAESTARKALSLSTGDLKAQVSAWQLIAKSLRARGRVDEALDADARANALISQ